MNASDKRKPIFGEYHVTYRMEGQSLIIELPEGIGKHLFRDGEMVIVGVGDHAEVWMPDDWQKECSELVLDNTLHL